MQLRLSYSVLRLPLGFYSVLSFVHSPHLHLSSATQKGLRIASCRLPKSFCGVFVVYVILLNSRPD
nr:MAG TPA: hypothetical protein [Caudoviricetes sp.]